jgi:NAD(P)-dependent dehydrogenase (short-subunit alcohol dehydrogenase family)
VRILAAGCKAVRISRATGGRPEEVASAILWLLSDEASSAIGAFFDLTGGR